MAAPKDKLVDHRDGNTLDNRRENLRLATPSQNNQNHHRINSQNRSGFTGVGWHKQKRKWRSWVSVNGKYIHVGLFENLSDAVEARKKASLEVYGEFSPEVL
jgi:hypothetical protein